MANYVFAYRGGGMAGSEEEQQKVMAAWGAWFGGLGESIVDAGNPFGESRSVASDGSVGNGGSSGLTGYSILSADDIEAAAAMAGGCPILSAGGSVEVYEVFPVM
jgi:hypothetical protein